MNNADLAEKLAEANGLTKADARKVVDGVFAAIADAAAKGDEIAINGFGKFLRPRQGGQGQAQRLIPADKMRRPTGFGRRIFLA